MENDDLQFANDVHGAMEQGSSVSAWVTVLTIGVLITSAVIWASYAQVEQLTAGQGKIIPSNQVQVVESLSPGIVAEIFVREGDKVEASQPLLRIDDTDLSARLGELNQKRVGLQVELTRLRAESGGETEFVFPANILDDERIAYEFQKDIFDVNRTNLKVQASVRRQQLIQKQQSLAETEANEEKHIGGLALLERELEILERLFKKKAVPEIEVLRLRRVVLDRKSDLKILLASKSRLDAEVAETRALLDSDETAFMAQVHGRISKVYTELLIVEESIRAAKDRVARAVLRAPVSGIVNRLDVTAIGEVVNAGVTIAEVVPVGDNFLIEARIKPKDIGFISPGLSVIIRLSAYDYTKYGTLKGRVERIGVDTITDESNETFYRVIVSTDGERSGDYGGKLRIIPGMIADVNISTGKRTILSYLLKPILKISDRALRDPT